VAQFSERPDLAQDVSRFSPDPSVTAPTFDLIGNHIAKIGRDGDFARVLIHPSCGNGIAALDDAQAILAYCTMNMAVGKLRIGAVTAQHDFKIGECTHTIRRLSG
jgi:hypothetical protein